jgi:hypothetical protein
MSTVLMAIKSGSRLVPTERVRVMHPRTVALAEALDAKFGEAIVSARHDISHGRFARASYTNEWLAVAFKDDEWIFHSRENDTKERDVIFWSKVGESDYFRFVYRSSDWREFLEADAADRERLSDPGTFRVTRLDEWGYEAIDTTTGKPVAWRVYDPRTTQEQRRAPAGIPRGISWFFWADERPYALMNTPPDEYTS